MQLILVQKPLPRCASQVLDCGAKASFCGAAQVLCLGFQAVARGATRCSSQMLGRGA
jgi:hypothetical protein